VQLSEVCVLEVVSCSRKTTILEAARMMRQHHAGDLIVVDEVDEERTPAGIITDRDIVVEVLGKGLDPAATFVGDVMVKVSHLVVARDTEDLSEAAERMRTHGVRRLPVINHAGKLVGVVTLDDLLQLLARNANLLAEIVTKEQAHEQRARR
jgi:CBS domain-containing protein